jgi:hypothetical protein
MVRDISVRQARRRYESADGVQFIRTSGPGDDFTHGAPAESVGAKKSTRDCVLTGSAQGTTATRGASAATSV